MAHDRLTEIRIRGIRALADVRLTLAGLTVLIGENSSGKSTLIEALEILSKLAQPSFLERLQEIHGGFSALRRVGESRIVLGFRIESSDSQQSALDYEITIGEDGTQLVVVAEILSEIGAGPPQPVIARDPTSSRYRALGLFERGTILVENKKVKPTTVLLTSFGTHDPDPAFRRVITVLEGIEVHPPVDVLPIWIGKEMGWSSPLRSSVQPDRANRVTLKGANLANAFHTLKEERPKAHWEQTLSYVRLGLGDDVEDVKLRLDLVAGAIALWLQYGCFREPISARALSDGTLSWLALVATYRLGGFARLIAFDEPESHIHPTLLMRALSLFESMSQNRPVLIATHSDRLLDGLSDPASAVVLLEVDERRAANLLRPDAESLRAWLDKYQGLGTLRAIGHERSVMTVREPKS